MDDKRLDVFSSNEFEQLETRRIQEIVAGHRFGDDVKNQTEYVGVMGQQGLEEGVLDANQTTEEFQGSYSVSLCIFQSMWGSILSLRCFWGTVSN